MKVKLALVNSDILVFDEKDWSILRKEHRIIGAFVGSLNAVPVLPLKLLPEEVHLLLDKQIGEIVRYKQVNFDSELFESNLLNEQRLVYKDNRKMHLQGRINDIVASKRRKGDTREEFEIFNEELNKSCEISKDKMIWPLTATPLCSDTETVDYSPAMRDCHKYAVFRDLWEKGYYITSGIKFGGDFLVYQGDPITHHAIFIIRCVKEKETMLPREIVAFGRLATSVKKRAILASLMKYKVSYITVNWIDD